MYALNYGQSGCVNESYWAGAGDARCACNSPWTEGWSRTWTTSRKAKGPLVETGRVLRKFHLIGQVEQNNSTSGAKG
ncbi:MAG: hypothetical protein A3J66_02095 [Candidatus Magasanikbacteria bacterium RIFCSPHIGHO2_02_FULL_47_14]|uniref:Uncharacterized protein n=1 Tax=Candidatus Magasanikbacteria bacterium RIFCSPHIGHO2_02_FULL_47_14 TaxID=1798680 RepID=A0A1F6MBA3_9BACT|nr:MAG: hypothetical protein A3J66_02095 [Candidatus Magasanikbacteria bacterium RIFCSPHIGHO2_02_FULL_47_14]